MVASERIYRALLVAYPKGFRRAFGEEMARAFRDLCREALGRGKAGGLLALWLRALLDLSANAFAERSRSIVSSSSSVRWGGIAAVAGGLLLVAHGIALPTIGNGGLNPPRDVMYLLTLVRGFGTLLVFGGLFGLARLVRRWGMLGLSGSSGGPGWARRTGAVGLVLAALAALASLALVVWPLATGGPFVRMPGGSSAALNFYWVLSLMLIFGLPLATVLLGVAAWRSGVLGRWRALPLAVGILASPLVALTLGAVVYLTLYLGGAEFPPDGNAQYHPMHVVPWARFLVRGGPELVAGAGWALLGLLLFAGQGGDERRPMHAD